MNRPGTFQNDEEINQSAIISASATLPATVEDAISVCTATFDADPAEASIEPATSYSLGLCTQMSVMVIGVAVDLVAA